MPREIDLREDLRAHIRQSGIDYFGVADITQVRADFLLDPGLSHQFNRALSLGKRLLLSVLDDVREGPTELYLHHYRQINYLLDRAALLTAGFIQDAGYRALPIAASQIVDWERQRAHVSHKRIGQLAGIGWLGRNNLLINPDCGAQLRLVSVLTDMPLEASAPIENDCGECQKCVSICPASAIKETREAFGHQPCFEKLKEFRRSGVVSQYICGLCVKVCWGTRR